VSEKLKTPKAYTNPWTMNGEVFDSPDKWAGFVYLIRDRENGKEYIGKKFFWSKRKSSVKPFRRVVKESDWKQYYGSNDEIKRLVKEFGGDRFQRIILSLHSLERDVNYTEVKFQYMFGVLEQVDAEGNSNWYNTNISGKHYFHLVKDITNRSIYSEQSR
jgi:hypothetical protein